ncbi:MAG: acetate/propionate family kinase [Alphaproteobacteria bacterium]|nr:acetate/propionate family kinase [Alphaproteobacteria bacterium]
MHVLVINCGSSSIKAEVVDADTGAAAAGLLAERVGTDGVEVTGTVAIPALPAGADHAAVLAAVLPALLAAAPGVGAVGHRVVHGGGRFTEPTHIDDDVVAGIEAVSPLAPLHNPPNLAGIRAARAILPDLPHVAVFDTAFHATLPRRARHYALPAELADRHGVRRYGFHGTSHAYVARRAAAWLGEDPRALRIITCHLGNGASVCAVEYGRSVETSMGMTPLEGLVMGTRSGDLDPGALLALMRAEGLDVDAADRLLNKQSGLLGLSGVSHDLRDIEARAAEGDERCRLAIQVYAHRVRRYIGAYAAVMGGVDAIVFTAGIGENSALMRDRIAQRMEWLGAHLDPDANRALRLTDDAPVAALSAAHSRVRLLAVRTDEQHEIARQAAAVVGTGSAAPAPAAAETPTIPIAISARHVHLTQEAVEALFGPGHTLTPRNPLSQPGQFACEETLTVHGPKRSIERVRVLGPVRPACQVEVSRTDEFFLGIDAPVRMSGNVANSPGCVLEGPAGRLTLEEGLICAWRHIHMTPADAELFGVAHGDVVEVAVDSAGRDLVFGDVVVRVKDSYALEMHVDTDEANAAELQDLQPGMLVPTQGRARVLRRQRGISG